LGEKIIRDAGKKTLSQSIKNSQIPNFSKKIRKANFK
jgi:hypothetical protein